MTATLQARVLGRAPEAEDVVSLRLAATGGEALPAFEPGAHVDLHLGPGLVRQYSLCNLAGEPWYELGVLLDAQSRGGSRAAHELREGDVLRIGVPRNSFPLAAAASHHLLLAGGIGITPLLGMAAALHRDGRHFSLHACARSAARLPFRDRLRDGPWASRVQIHIDGDGGPGHCLDDIVGRAPPDTHVYVCGPTGFIEAARRASAAAGLGEDRLHSESFSPTAGADAADLPFEVELNGGRVLQVAAGQTVAQCLEAHGVFVPLSCEQGICGTCVTPLRGGIPDHRDSYLTPDERASNALFTPCCSRALSPRLVLDLDG
ncbi:MULTISPECIES: PDR/VanB family oxidoreductase [unclassified Luteimonas]